MPAEAGLNSVLEPAAVPRAPLEKVHLYNLWVCTIMVEKPKKKGWIYVRAGFYHIRRRRYKGE